MKKIGFSILSGLALFLLAAPVTFAADEEVMNVDEPEEAMVEVEAEESWIDPCCDYGGGYYGQTYINVSTTMMAEVEQVSLTANFTEYGYESRTEANNALQAKYDSIKQSLQGYGKVTRTGMYVYESWEKEGSYEGNLSIRVTLTNMGDYEKVDSILYRSGFSSWLELKVDEETLLNLEVAAGDQLKSMLERKESLYEKILGYELETIKGLSLYSWVNSYEGFDPATGQVEVQISADAWYE